MADVRPTEGPLDAPRRSWLLVGAVISFALAIVAISFDLSMMSLADRSQLRGDARRALDLAEAFSFGPSALVIVLGVVLADRRSKRLTCKLFAYPIATGLLANLAKLGVPRIRPRALEALATGEVNLTSGWETFSLSKVLPGISQIGSISSSDWQSFPSAHTATAVGLAIGLSRLYPQARGYFIFLSVLAGLQRVFAVAHYPSDVFAGAGLAMAVCWVLERNATLSLGIAALPTRAAVSDSMPQAA